MSVTLEPVQQQELQIEPETAAEEPAAEPEPTPQDEARQAEPTDAPLTTSVPSLQAIPPCVVQSRLGHLLDWKSLFRLNGAAHGMVASDTMRKAKIIL